MPKGSSYSELREVVAMPKPPSTKGLELCAGWLTLKRSGYAMGSKRRYCKLVATVATNGGSDARTHAATGGAETGSISRVMLFMLRHEGDADEAGRALDLAEVGDVRLDPKVAARVMVQAGAHKLLLTAETQKEAVRWLQQLRNHVAASHESAESHV